MAATDQLKTLNLEGVSPSGRYNKDELAAYIVRSVSKDSDSRKDSTNVIAHLNAMESRLTASVDAVKIEIKTEITALRTDLAAEKARVSALQQTVDALLETTSSQQRYLERLDARERSQNFILIGVPEAGCNLGSAKSDTDKLELVRGVICPGSTFRLEHKRLGIVRPNVPPRPRPILVTLPSDIKRQDLLDKAGLLANDATLRSVKMKKDQHPAIRKEWRRLFEAEADEKTKPENAGSAIVLDRKNRTLIRDGIVIDRFCSHF